MNKPNSITPPKRSRSNGWQFEGDMTPGSWDQGQHPFTSIYKALLIPASLVALVFDGGQVFLG